MRLLYVPSGHPLQEADDCLMWQKLGIEWMSTGYYAYVDKPGDLPEITVDRSNRELYNLLRRQNLHTQYCDRPGTNCGKKNRQWTNQVARNNVSFNKRFIDNFDAILFGFFISNVTANWDFMCSKKVFLKTYSMHETSDEKIMGLYRAKGLKLIRNSPKEHLRGDLFAGVDAVIRGSVVKDENEISGWTGHNERVCTFTSYMYEDKVRGEFFQRVCTESKYPIDLFGINNNFVSHERKLEVLRGHRVNLVTGTPNANNTYSMVEGWIMGQPLVIFGPDMWHSRSYECDELVQHGVTGFIANNPTECAEYIELLMKDEALARRIGAAGREAAIKVYGRDTLAEQWKTLFRENELL